MQLHSPIKEKAPTANAAEAIPKCKTIIELPESGCKFSLPSADTLDAVVLAVLLTGRTISPFEAIYCNLHLTRLANQIHVLRHRHGLLGRLYSEPLPLTKAQQKLKRATPFHRYWLDAGVVSEAEDKVSGWVQEVLSFFDLDVCQFPKRCAAQGVVCG